MSERGARNAPVRSIGAVPETASIPLLSRRLVFVLGKGGVGRSVTAAALGMVAASRGARTIVAEVSGRGELAEAFGVAPESGESEVSPGLWAIQIDTDRALDEYLHQHLPLRMLADLVGATRLIGYLAAATPGLRELLNVGKLWELAQPERRVPDGSPYDLVVVDAPASGHALALLTAPRAFARTAKGGPIARQGGRIDDFLHDRASTAIVAVSRAEDAAVSELIELQTKLADQAGVAIDLAVVNAVSRDPLPSADASALGRLLGASGSLPAGARAAVEHALSEDRESHAERVQIERLRDALGGVPVTLLRRADGPELGMTGLESLRAQLEGAL